MTHLTGPSGSPGAKRANPQRWPDFHSPVSMGIGMWTPREGGQGGSLPQRLSLKGLMAKGSLLTALLVAHTVSPSLPGVWMTHFYFPHGVEEQWGGSSP